MSRERKEDYGSAYLYAEDLLRNGEFQTVTVKIEEVIPPNTMKAANGKMIDKPTLRFEGKSKLLVLCKTNQAMVMFCTGGPLCDAAGKSITLQPRFVDAFGDEVVALRVIPPPGIRVRRSVMTRLGRKAVWEGPKAEPTKQPEAT